jgi:bifunctional non-homologous end joining protein LigD
MNDEIEIGRRRVRVTHPERVLFPRDGVTKRDLAQYYVEIGDVIVPHLRDRPFTLKRCPDYVVFDIDPPESRNGFAQAIRVAHLIREALEGLELHSYVKTSGADGIHVLVPITRRSTYPDTYEFAERVSRGLEAENPGLVTTEWLKKKRRGVLVDHRQNGRGKTIAAAYSVRPKPGAPVSTPLRWEELGEKVRPRDFGMREALERVERHGDLFEPVLQGGQALSPPLRQLRG